MRDAELKCLVSFFHLAARLAKSKEETLGGFPDASVPLSPRAGCPFRFINLSPCSSGTPLKRSQPLRYRRKDVKQLLQSRPVEHLVKHWRQVAEDEAALGGFDALLQVDEFAGEGAGERRDVGEVNGQARLA